MCIGTTITNLLASPDVKKSIAYFKKQLIGNLDELPLMPTYIKTRDDRKDNVVREELADTIMI